PRPRTASPQVLPLLPGRIPGGRGEAAGGGGDHRLHLAAARGSGAHDHIRERARGAPGRHAVGGDGGCLATISSFSVFGVACLSPLWWGDVVAGDGGTGVFLLHMTGRT